MGGDIPWVGISAKSGEGIDDLLDLVVLTADLAELEGDNNATPTGHVIESKTDPKRGNTATLIIKEGTLRTGQFVIIGDTYSQYVSWRISKTCKRGRLIYPVRIAGFTEVPEVGVHS